MMLDGQSGNEGNKERGRKKGGFFLDEGGHAASLIDLTRVGSPSSGKGVPRTGERSVTP